MFLRVAEISDAAAIRNIYAFYVENTAITFEVSVPTVSDFENRINSTLKEYPYLVAVEGEEIIGYTYAGRQMERAAYQWNSTLSVYLGRDYRKGVGTKLYMALMNLLKLQNIINVYGGVTWPNPASEALHLKLGFNLLGRYRRTGFKNGCWHDVVWFEKCLTDSKKEEGETSAPATPILFPELNAQVVSSCLAQF